MDSRKSSGITLVEIHGIEKSVPLKIYLKWLKLNIRIGERKFSHASCEKSLHPNLNIFENLFLGQIELIENINEGAQLIDVLERYSLRSLSPYLVKLNRYPSQLSDQEKIIVSLCKSIISSPLEIFVEIPQNIEPLCLRRIKEVLVNQAKDKKVYLYTEAISFWLDSADDILKYHHHQFATEELLKVS